jgi:uncharacterized protein YhfF
VPLKDAARQMPDSQCWNIYTRLMLGGFIPTTKEVDVFSFGNSPEMAARIAHLVMKGRKRATSANPAALKKLGLAIPFPGMVSILTDGFGIPLCCLQTKRVEFRKFSEVSESIAIDSGEGDLSLKDWRTGYRDYFRREADRLGLAFDEDTEIFTEWFELVHVFGAK